MSLPPQITPTNKNLYRILHIAPTTDFQTINNAYLNLKNKYWKNINSDPNYTRKYIRKLSQLDYAYSILSANYKQKIEQIPTISNSNGSYTNTNGSNSDIRSYSYSFTQTMGFDKKINKQEKVTSMINGQKQTYNRSVVYDANGKLISQEGDIPSHAIIH